MHLGGHVGQLVAPAVGDDHVALRLEGRKVVRHLGAEEPGRVERGLAGHHGNALGLDALHDALRARRAGAVGARLHGEAAHAHHRRRRAGAHKLRHVAAVGRQLLGVLRQAAAAVTEAEVVVVAADAGLLAHAKSSVTGRHSLGKGRHTTLLPSL